MNLIKPSTSKFHNATHQGTTPSLAHKPKVCSSLFDLPKEESMSSDGFLSSYELDIRNEKLENSKNIFNNVSNEQPGSDGKNSIKYTLTVYRVYQPYLTNIVTFAMEVC